jgi:hypothetical protein
MANQRAIRNAAKAINSLRDQLEKGEARRLPNAPRNRLYSISYDLHEGDDYSAVIARLNELNAVHWLDSTWVFRSQQAIETLDAEFSKLFPEDKGYLLSSVGSSPLGRPAAEYRKLPEA